MSSLSFDGIFTKFNRCLTIVNNLFVLGNTQQYYKKFVYILLALIFVVNVFPLYHAILV